MIMSGADAPEEANYPDPPGVDFDWLAIIKCPNWDTYHVTMVDVVDDDTGHVRRAHDATGEAFEVDRAERVGDEHKINVLACIRALPGPYFTLNEAIAAVMKFHRENKN